MDMMLSEEVRVSWESRRQEETENTTRRCKGPSGGSGDSHTTERLAG